MVSLSVILIVLHASDPQFPYNTAEFGFFVVTALVVGHCLRTGSLLLKRSKLPVVNTAPETSII